MLLKAINFIDEVWIPISENIVPNIEENKYIVSNYGYISNIDFPIHGKVYSFNYLGQFKNRPYVNLIDKFGNGLMISVSRIVAKAFCPGYKEGLEVNHKDGNPRNNYYMNLEWITRKENIRHAYDNNLIQSLISENMVKDICRLLEEDKLSAYDISKVTGLDKISSKPISLISAIKKKKLWTHISKDYNIPLGRHGRILNDNQINQVCSILEQDGIDTPIDIVLEKLQIVPTNNDERHKYSNILSAIKYKRRYTYISDNYSF